MRYNITYRYSDKTSPYTINEECIRNIIKDYPNHDWYGGAKTNLPLKQIRYILYLVKTGQHKHSFIFKVVN